MEKLNKEIAEFDFKINELNKELLKKQKSRQELKDKYDMGDFKTNLDEVKRNCTVVYIPNSPNDQTNEPVRKGCFMSAYKAMCNLAERIELLESENSSLKEKVESLGRHKFINICCTQCDFNTCIRCGQVCNK